MSLNTNKKTEFIEQLFTFPVHVIADLENSRPKSRSIKAKIALLNGIKGAEYSGRANLMLIYGRHGLQGPQPFAEALAELGHAQFTQSIQRVLQAQRHELPRLLHFVEAMKKGQIAFDYHALYHDLIYFGPKTNIKWQTQYTNSVLQNNKR